MLYRTSITYFPAPFYWSIQSAVYNQQEGTTTISILCGYGAETTKILSMFGYGDLTADPVSFVLTDPLFEWSTGPIEGEVFPVEPPE